MKNLSGTYVRPYKEEVPVFKIAFAAFQKVQNSNQPFYCGNYTI